MSKAGTAPDEQKEETKKKTSPKKADKIAAELKKLKDEKKELKDQLLRKVAEFDNYKKRTERDFYDRVQNANEKLIAELLPIMDDLKRALDHARQSKDAGGLLEGTELIEKKLKGTLEKQGLQPINAIGEEFDPDQHDALLQMEKDGVESGIVLDEYLTGYTLNGKVIRHSQVIVAK